MVFNTWYRRKLFGKEIPFRLLGFNSVHELLCSMPDVCLVILQRSKKMLIYHGFIDNKIKDLANDSDIFCLKQSITQNESNTFYKNINYKQKQTKYIDSFIQEHFLYSRNLHNTEVLKAFAQKREHEVIVSSVCNPCNIEVQLVANRFKLEKLMEKLQKKYNGLDTLDLRIPDDYILTHRLCAAPSIDNNWYRCRIVELNGDSVTVFYLDYGDEARVRKNKLKFLCKEFDMPCQAVKAKFANIKYNPKWNKYEESKQQIINYLLQIVKGKNLRAKIGNLFKKSFFNKFFNFIFVNFLSWY